MINREATIRWKGYDPDDLSPKSNRKVWVICEGCQRGRWLKYYAYHDGVLCHDCANKKKGKDKQVCKKQSDAAKERWGRPGEKEKISGKNSILFGQDQSGKNNGFYGKKHTKESIESMRKNHSDTSGKNNPNYNPEIDNFIEENTNKHLCKCGCGNYITIKRKYFTIGIPKFIHGHWMNTDEGKDVIRRSNLSHPPKNRNTSIELKIQEILCINGYNNFNTHISLCGICQPDIVFEEEKIIIQCDGDYWHNYPNGLDRDHNQDKILKENGWTVIRFWEHEINDNTEECLHKFELEYNKLFLGVIK